jgi:hypothetical protein
MIERSLMRTTLAALEVIGEAGIREDILLNEIALQCARHLEASQIREHLAEAQRRGWADTSVGVLRETRWRILPAGINALHDFLN